MIWCILFVFGIAIGSFLNVVILRYDGERFLLDHRAIGGRSHCPHCRRTLRWFELIPVASYLLQGGRCRNCGVRLTVQYPIVELLSGIIFMGVPFALAGAPIALSVLWVTVIEALLVMSFIDLRLGIIPDEINIVIGVVGVFLAIFSGQGAGGIIGRIAGAALAGAFFGLLIAITRGRGMGMGDLKLAVPLGLVFGWPAIVLVLVLAFVLGAAVGMIAVIRHRKTMKGTVPFGPFLALSSVIAFFWGPQAIAWYLSLIGVR